ncbi:MAG: plasmid recombination protein, partial [Muribaculaceae bacterium]|nr:plasmid recombination protein [Muribaculaceae bacterium]
MAHVEKYTRGATGNMLAHYDRTKISSTSLIDLDRTLLNYNLAENDQPLTQLDFIHKRLSEIKVLNRKDVNVFCDWIVTAPQELSENEYADFFRETYKFLNERYGKENVISAYVHMDQSQP